MSRRRVPRPVGTTNETPASIHGIPRMLTTTQVAETLGVNPSTLSRWRARGIGPRVYWLGPATPRYREDDVLAWLEGTAA